MDVLLAAATSPNPFVPELARALSTHPEVFSVKQDLDDFWKAPNSADIVHVHWPRALFSNWTAEDRNALSRLECALEAWTEATIVNTVHNLRPHYREAPIYDDLNHLVFKYVDGYIHLGHASQRLFRREYPETTSEPHEVIPHGRYNGFENAVTRDEARRHLGLDPDSCVVLAFGALRHPEELRLLVEGFGGFRHKGKKLVIAGRLAWAKGPVRRRMLRAYHRLRFLSHPIQFHLGAIDDDEVQYFLNACDQLVIPRKDVLNSGNVALGFTFGRVVVGPNCGVIREVLEETGNPIFDPQDPSTLSDALDKGARLVEKKAGHRNQRYAEKHLNWEQIARKHVDFYSQMLSE
jgi:glycosyltransferase involved in cell wall biosynthesis